mgnify:CR=1 FL=1
MHNIIINKYYFISKFDTNYIDKQNKDTAIVYRNYNADNNRDTILLIKKYCKNKGFKFYLANNIRLAVNLNLDGAYIPSFNKSTKHLAFSYKQKFNIVGSAHNLKEIKIKEKQKVNRIFLSSIFKKNKNFLGINKFKLLSKLTSKKIVILGGISKKNIKKLKILNQSEFAGISYFE